MRNIYAQRGINQGPKPTAGNIGRFKVSLFRSQYAPAVEVLSFTSLETFAHLLRTTTGGTKTSLPWFKLATFTGELTEKGCCRADAFVTSLTGAEVDYDGGEITVLDAALWAQAEWIAGVFSETASSTPTAPRWRGWFPADQAYTGTPEELKTLRQRWVARINGIVGGKLDGCSFNLSQSYYVGGITGRPQPAVIVTRGRRIDLCTHLDAGAIFKNGRSEPSDWIQAEPLPLALTETDDDPALLLECQRIVANFTKTVGLGATPQGGHIFQLVAWLGDLSAAEGLTPSARMIRRAIRDLYPDTSISRIEGMFTRRHKPRGCHIINPTTDDLLAEPVE
jgi:hypothetical protein